MATLQDGQTGYLHEIQCAGNARMKLLSDRDSDRNDPRFNWSSGDWSLNPYDRTVHMAPGK